MTKYVDIVGVLACLDSYMNIALEQTEEYVNGQVKLKVFLHQTYSIQINERAVSVVNTVQFDNDGLLYKQPS